MTRSPSGPVVGYRVWRVHGGRLWPVRFSARHPWPHGDVQSACEAWGRKSIETGHRAPAPTGTCLCGLYAYHEIESAIECGHGDVWGAVLGWGDVEVHSDGFRSEWQRPIVLAEFPWNEEARANELRDVASFYGAPLAPADGVEAIAREHGDPIPIGLVPVTPLSLLSDETAWMSDDNSVEWATLARQIHGGSVIARRVMAGQAVDLAVSAAVSGRRSSDGVELRAVEVALLGLLAAVETWTMPARRIDDGLAARHFRSHAVRWIDRALEHFRGGFDAALPTTLTYGQVRRDAATIPGSGEGLRPAGSRPTELMTEEQILAALRQLAPLQGQSDFLVDRLWRVLHHASFDPNYCPSSGSVSLARELYRAGTRANPIVSTLIDAKRRGRKQRTLMHRIAEDRRVHPYLRARALERIAHAGSLESVMAFLEHPLADPRAAARLLSRSGDVGRTQAKAIVAQGPATEAQLHACVRVLGRAAAQPAEERIQERPVPHVNLLRACVRALPAERAAAIVHARIETGEALANRAWLTVLGELDREDQEAVVVALVQRATRVAHPPTRAATLWAALDLVRVTGFRPRSRT